MSRKRKDGWLSAYLRRERPVRVDRHSHIARAVRRVARLLRRAHRNGQLRRGVEVDAGGGDGAVDAVVAELRRVQRQRVDVLRSQTAEQVQPRSNRHEQSLLGWRHGGLCGYLRQSAEEMRAVVLAAGGDAARQLLVLVHVREVADADRLVAVVLAVDRGQRHVEDRP